MKILVTVHTYYPNHDGVQFVTQYLAEGLMKKGHSVTVITYKYPDRCDITEEDVNGVHVIRWDARTRHTFHLGDKKGFQKYILKHQDNFDVMVNVGTQTALTDWLFPIYKNITLPRLLYIHSIYDFQIHWSYYKSIKEVIGKIWNNIRWGIYFKKNGKVFQSYNVVTQLHEKDYSYKFFKDNYGIESQIIENAAEEDFFNDRVDSTVIVPEKYVINVSNFNERKNQKGSIKLFLESDVPDDWHLFLIGSSNNSYTDELRHYEKRRRAELKLGQAKPVHILTGIPREQISTYVKKAQVYIISSLREAFPISLVESMAASVPFISFDVGIVKYLPGGVVAENEEEYLQWLHNFSHNENIRRQYGEAGHRAAVERYRVDGKVDQLEKILQELRRDL